MENEESQRAESTVETCLSVTLDNEDIVDKLELLDTEEIDHIAEVISMDRIIRKKSRDRNRQIADNLDQQIREIEMKDVDSGKTCCIVCGEKFSFFRFQKKCDRCQRGSCNHCHKEYSGGHIICNLCILYIEKEGKTGKWFTAIAKENNRLKHSATTVFWRSLRMFKAKTVNLLNHHTSPTASLKSPNFNDGLNMSCDSSLPYLPVYNAKARPPRTAMKTNPSLPHENEYLVDRVDSRANGGDMMNSGQYPVDRVDARANGGDMMNSGQISVNQSSSVDVNVGSDGNQNISNPNNQSSLRAGPPSNLSSMKSMSGSMMSVCSETEESYKHKIPISGEIQMVVYYDEVRKTLNVYVEQCRNIAVADRRNRKTNPYIKTYLLPDKTKMSKKKSTCLSCTVTPTFKETMSYLVPNIDDMASRCLSVAVWHKSSLMHYNLFLGEVHMELKMEDLKYKEPQWYNLKPKMSFPTRAAGLIYKGELMFEIQYKSSSLKNSKGSVNVKVIKAKDLNSDHKVINAYVKGYLLPNRSRKDKRKTNEVKNKDPVWNRMLTFENVDVEELKDRSLELWVMHKNTLKSDDFLGGIRLNHGLGLYRQEQVIWMDAQGQEKDIWQRFLSNNSEWTKATVNLRPNLDYF